MSASLPVEVAPSRASSSSEERPPRPPYLVRDGKIWRHTGNSNGTARHGSVPQDGALPHAVRSESVAPQGALSYLEAEVMLQTRN